VSVVKLAALDTDVLTVLVSPVKALSESDKKLRDSAERHIENLAKKRVAFVIPAPVLAELSAKTDGAALLEEIAQVLKGSRVEALTADAAVLAGRMIAHRLRERKAAQAAVGIRPIPSRVLVKFDPLISAVAHAAGAQYLLTGNPDDHASALKAIESGVVVIDARLPLQGEQTVMKAMLVEGSGSIDYSKPS
jgi:hypothetical protein